MNGKQQDAWGPAFGPWQGMVQSIFGNLDGATQGCEPLIKGLTRLNLEAVALVNRRAQAILEVPSRLGRCRTPQDLVGEQLRFAQTAYEHYSESARKSMTIWMSMVPALPVFSAAYKNGEARERDFITFPEVKEETSARRVSGTKRAA
jgi:hypothetical protein